jgi:hypothetical protein
VQCSVNLQNARCNNKDNYVIQFTCTQWSHTFLCFGLWGMPYCITVQLSWNSIWQMNDFLMRKIINFLTLYTWHYLMYNEGFYPNFYHSKWSPNNHTYFHCTCYKLLHLAIHNCTECSRPGSMGVVTALMFRSMGDVTALMFSTSLSWFVRGFVIVFMILLIVSWMYIPADSCNWWPFKKNT